ncbi:MAG: hypothetical protein ABI760_06715 [Ferruginibacter sp.]
MNTRQKCPDYPGSNIYPIKEDIEAMVNTAWVLSIRCLWPSTRFSVKDCSDANKFIRGFIINETDPYKAYMEYCQRVLLAERQLIYDPCYKINPVPVEWFNSSNRNGFIQSLEWFQKLKQIRIKRPLYKQAMKTFCEAILDIVEVPTIDNFNYWLTWFKEKDAPVYLIHFILFTIYYQKNYLPFSYLNSYCLLFIIYK